MQTKAVTDVTNGRGGFAVLFCMGGGIKLACGKFVCGTGE